MELHYRIHYRTHYRTTFWQCSLALMLLATIAVFPGTLYAALSGADTTSNELQSVRLQSQIATSFALNPYLRANHLQVKVAQGKATLSGKVAEDTSKELAAEIALGIDGISAVDNQILVEPTYLPPTGPLSWAEKVDDATITAAIRAKLRWHKDIDAVSTSVTTSRGQVTLTGRVDNAAGKMLAGQLALNTRGVVSVTNELQITPQQLTAGELSKMQQRAETHNISDGWITTKVKSSFMYASNINSAGINVSTNNGVVTLTGKVGSGTERALAIEMAQNIRGVKSVTATALEY